ncbi:MAG: NRAMP family divalent metal transporter [bacterium]|jgi:NRAMP (natural resistance-associated macrophage protein)-like metal ion transporter|nr:divalent metal cation transporter [Chitinophagaceae bacterium]
MNQHPGNHHKRSRRSPWSALRSQLGPGLVTGASDDDPSGIATYSQAGAGFGLSTLWTSLLTLPLMISVQEMCARIGLVTRKGLTAVIRLYYPKPVLWLIVLVSFPAIILNIGANLSGMGAVANMLLPDIPAPVFNILFGISITYITIALPYARIANILRWLCLSLLCYMIVPFLTRTDWPQVLKHSLIPEIRWDRDFILIIVALLGTTISPYLFFWQTSMEVEEAREHRLVVNKRVMDSMQQDVRVGMFFSNLVSFFIILTAGSVMFPAGIQNISTVQEAAMALRPLAGDMSYLLFSVGVIGTGLLSIPVLAGAMSYMVSEAFGWKEGLNKKFHQARGFYGVMVVSILSALLINFSGLSPMRALILTAVVYGVMAPVVIAIILHICNNRLIMGDRVNGKWSNLFGWSALLLMSAAAIALLYYTVV